MGFGEQIKTTVSGIEIFKKNVSKAIAGENLGALIRGVKISSVQRGMLLCALGTAKMSNHFDASMYLLTRGEGGRSKPITSKYIQQLFSKTWNISCRVDFVDNSMLMPGDHGKVRLTLLKNMVMTQGQPFTIRENNSTVATGLITETLKPIELPMNKLSKVVIEGS